MTGVTVTRPFNEGPLLAYLRARAMGGVEKVTKKGYRRSIRHGSFVGVIEVDLEKASSEGVAGVSCLSTAAGRPTVPSELVKNLIDADAPVGQIDEDLRRDPLLAPYVKRHPGIRIPGTVDPFELSVRAILGQQISVGGAARLASRVVEGWGELLPQPWKDLNRLFPTPEALADAPLEEAGLSRGRAGAIRSLAAAVSTDQLRLEIGADKVGVEQALLAIRGIGPWTAAYIALRALGDRDAIPTGDLGLRQTTGCRTPKELCQMAERWRPWRGYAVVHLWSDFLRLSDASDR